MACAIAALFRASAALSMRKIKPLRLGRLESSFFGDAVLYIVAAGWLYVVLMMSITERSVAAGLGTFVFYGVFPLSVVLYLLATPSRRRAAKARRAAQLDALRNQSAAAPSAADPDDGAQVVNDPPVAPERIEPR
jgi:hypothetical protein